MSGMQEYIPSIISIMVAIVSGIASYAAASKKARSELETLKESNKHDLEKLLEQHKLDLESLEHSHAMEIEKINLEFRHQLELQQAEFNNQLGSDLIKEAMKLPEVRQQIGQSVRNGNVKKRK